MALINPATDATSRGFDALQIRLDAAQETQSDQAVMRYQMAPPPVPASDPRDDRPPATANTGHRMGPPLVLVGDP